VVRWGGGECGGEVGLGGEGGGEVGWGVRAAVRWGGG
jgi:hypothetical protein